MVHWSAFLNRPPIVQGLFQSIEDEGHIDKALPS